MAVPKEVKDQLKCLKEVKHADDGGEPTVKITDGGIAPVEGKRSMRFSYPTLVVEVGYSESLAELQKDGELLLGDDTEVQIFVGVKVPYNAIDSEEERKNRLETG